MTVSTNYSFNLTRDQIIAQGLFRAGIKGQDADPELIDKASNELNVDLKKLQRKSVVLSTIERTTLAVVAGTAEYTLPADTLDVLDPVMWQPTGATAYTEATLQGRDEYMQIPDKTHTGNPYLVYVEKQLTVKVVLWPVPDAAGTLAFARERLVRDLDAGTNPDLQVGWLDVVIWMAALKLAMAHNIAMERIAFIQNKLTEAIRDLSGDDDEHGDVVWSAPYTRTI